MLPAVLKDESWGQLEGCEWGVVPDPLSLCPSDLGLHKPFSGPSTRQTRQICNGRGFCPNSSMPPRFLRSNSDQATGCRLTSTHPLLLCRHMANMEPRAHLGWSTSRCCWVGHVTGAWRRSGLTHGGQAEIVWVCVCVCFFS